MIILRIALIANAENISNLEAILETNRKETKKFAGCHCAELYRNNTKFFIYEEWDSQTTFDAYRKSSYFDELGGKIFPLLSEKPNAAYYQAEKFA